MEINPLFLNSVRMMDNVISEIRSASKLYDLDMQLFE